MAEKGDAEALICVKSNSPLCGNVLRLSLRQSRTAGMKAIMNDSGLGKLVVTVILLISLAIWLKWERSQLPGCGTNCPTDFSASRR